MFTLLLFLVIFSALVLVHEFGHFIVAKRSGMKVEEFGMGLPPRAWTLFTDKSGTRYTLNWIPFGGFVRLLGESGEAENAPDGASVRLFTDFPLWRRIAVVVAGVVMNLLLAVGLLSVVFAVGFSPLAIVDDHALPFDSYLVQSDSFAKANGTLRINVHPAGVPIERVEPGSLAEGAGVRSGDRVTSVDGAPVGSGYQVSSALLSARGRDVVVGVARTGEAERTVSVRLLPDRPFGIYVGPDIEVVPMRFAWYQAPLRATEEVAKQSVLTVFMLKDVVVRLLSQGTVPEGVAGPVGIFQMTGQVSQAGVVPTLVFVALLSVSLAVMNILPFPALDGGRLLFLVVELVTRRRPNRRAEGIIHAAGFAILLLLIGVITFNDIGRLFAA